MSPGPGPGAVRATAAAVASGRITAVGAVREALRRIEERDPGLGAVVALRADEALAEAGEIDDRRHAGGAPRGLLEGVPVLVKDIEDVAGLPTRRGSLLLADAPPATEDEFVPRLLRRAGAVIVGQDQPSRVRHRGVLRQPTRRADAQPWNHGATRRAARAEDRRRP